MDYNKINITNSIIIKALNNFKWSNTKNLYKKIKEYARYNNITDLEPIRKLNVNAARNHKLISNYINLFDNKRIYLFCENYIGENIPLKYSMPLNINNQTSMNIYIDNNNIAIVKINLPITEDHLEVIKCLGIVYLYIHYDNRTLAINNLTIPILPDNIVYISTHCDYLTYYTFISFPNYLLGLNLIQCDYRENDNNICKLPITIEYLRVVNISITYPLPYNIKNFTHCNYAADFSYNNNVNITDNLPHGVRTLSIHTNVIKFTEDFANLPSSIENLYINNLSSHIVNLPINIKRLCILTMDKDVNIVSFNKYLEEIFIYRLIDDNIIQFLQSIIKIPNNLKKIIVYSYTFTEEVVEYIRNFKLKFPTCNLQILNYNNQDNDIIRKNYIKSFNFYDNY